MFFSLIAEEQKTKEDEEVEGNILREMMDIVEKRDSLIALLEEDRLRCFLKRRGSAPDLSNTSSLENSLDECPCPSFLFVAFLCSVLYLVLVSVIDLAWSW